MKHCKECGELFRPMRKNMAFCTDRCRDTYNKRYMANWRAANKDKVKEHQSRWLEKNPDYMREYQEKNKDIIAEKKREYIHRNKDRIREVQKIYRIKNREKIRAVDDAWKARNMDKVKEYRRKAQIKWWSNLSEERREDYRNKQREYRKRRKQASLDSNSGQPEIEE